MKELVIAGQVIARGTHTSLDIPVAKLYTGTDIYIPVHVIRAKKDGPTMFVSAAIHGDELNGVEVVRRLIQAKNIKLSRGTLILVPMVNVYGVLSQSRYMPDRRDLNRSFPGSAKGSLAGRLANIFLEEIVSKCEYGIDLHTGAIHRSNLPQVRANLKDEVTRNLAECFGVPVLLNSDLRDGSLRHTAVDKGIRILLYEAGQALRYDEMSIRAGIQGVTNVLSELGMVKKKRSRKKLTPYIANNSAWVRAGESGFVNDLKQLGDAVVKGEVLAQIGSPFGDITDEVKATRSGIIIGKQNIPLVQEGDAMFHVAFFSEADDDVADTIVTLEETLMDVDSQPPEGLA